MTDDVTAAQVRGARGMLDWSMLDLSRAAELSISTVKRFEHGGPQPVSREARHAIHDALEAEGIRFLDDDGFGAGLRLQGELAPGAAQPVPSRAAAAGSAQATKGPLR